MRVISHMSVFVPGCPQSNPHHYVFMPDLCGVVDVVVFSLPVSQDGKQKGDKHCKPVLGLHLYLCNTKRCK